MNISNIASNDLAYTKSEVSTADIKRPTPEIRQSAPKVSQSIPELKEDLSFGEKMEQINKKEKIDDIVDAINSSNKNLKSFDRKLELSVHEKTREVMIKVIDTLTDEVIREVPSEKVLDTVAIRRESLGMLMDRKI